MKITLLKYVQDNDAEYDSKIPYSLPPNIKHKTINEIKENIIVHKETNQKYKININVPMSYQTIEIEKTKIKLVYFTLNNIYSERKIRTYISKKYRIVNEDDCKP